MNEPNLQAGLAVGKMLHRRHLPKPHQFSYRQSMLLLDLDDIPQKLHPTSWWQQLKFAGLRLRRDDYLQPQQRSIADAVRQHIYEHNGLRLEGKIFFLGHVRQWGACFNPVVFYFCHDLLGKLRAIVAEINNTPWDERHRYVLMINQSTSDDKTYKFSFPKTFHVSPFMPMDIDYQWAFTFYRSHIGIFMSLNRAGERVFDVSLKLQIKPLDRLGQIPWRHPFQCQRVIVGIYWQALLLWLKRLRVFPHP